MQPAEYPQGGWPAGAAQHGYPGQPGHHVPYHPHHHGPQHHPLPGDRYAAGPPSHSMGPPDARYSVQRPATPGIPGGYDDLPAPSYPDRQHYQHHHQHQHPHHHHHAAPSPYRDAPPHDAAFPHARPAYSEGGYDDRGRAASVASAATAGGIGHVTRAGSVADSVAAARTPAVAAPPMPRIGAAAGADAREGLTTSSRGFVLLPPALFGSWRKAPANPAIGLGGIAPEDLCKDDFKFYCDPCQKGFNSKRHYDAHMEDHIYCEHPGCKFTCRKGKEWKMELHVAALHNRPDAPNLEDNEAYLKNRKAKFPTVETVQTKVEELYYKASRGEVLPDERRRWLKQHGVFVSRKWYLPVMREGDPALEESRRRRAEKRERAVAAAAQDGADDQQQRRPQQPSAEEGKDAPANGEDLSKYARKPGEKMLPLGPNGRYTKGQLVQLARERYENANRAPAYYVCNRCGEKGHWVEACPKAKDAAFDFEARWAEPKPGANAAAATKAKEDGDNSNGPASSAAEAEAPVAENSGAAAPDDDGDDGKLEEVSAKPADVDPALRAEAEARRRVNAPALEARLAAAQQRSARRAATAALEEGAPDSEALEAAQRRARMRRMPTGPPKPTLWDRLTEDQRLNEHSVLLQAIRFFTVRNFFDAPNAQPGAAADSQAEDPQPTATPDVSPERDAADPRDQL